MKRLVVISHKPCWRAADSATGFATSGGFPFQMEALAGLFDATVVMVPIVAAPAGGVGIPLTGPGMRVVALTSPHGADGRRKLALPWWVLRNFGRLLREIERADLVHTPIPGDLGTIGLLLALVRGKPLFVRYCGDWGRRSTLAERFWHWLMERFAGGQRVMMATGGGAHRPSANPALTWIFATSLRRKEIESSRRIRSAPGREPRLITVARQERSKGTDRLIRALAILRRRFPGISLDVVGDGSQLRALRELAGECGVGAWVRFHGQQGHRGVMELLQAADLFCLPTLSEGFPKAVHEALACGLPVVTTAVSVLPELVGETAGTLIGPEATAGELAAAIERCLVDHERYAAMSATATRRAAQYSLEEWQETIRRRLAEPGLLEPAAAMPAADNVVRRAADAATRGEKSS